MVRQVSEYFMENEEWLDRFHLIEGGGEMIQHVSLRSNDPLFKRETFPFESFRNAGYARYYTRELPDWQNVLDYVRTDMALNR